MKRQLIKGNEAVIYGAILGGCTHFFGYPITPASEVAHAAAALFRKTGRTFLQAEDEVNAINMVYGASAAGARVMTASSGPGVALMSEGLSYLAGADLPAVIVDIQRAGPGLGNIWVEQGDYNMVVKGGGHGCYRNVVLAPSSVQEMCDFTYRAFELADRYRVTVVILADGSIGQMMEPVVLPSDVAVTPHKDWALNADEESRKNLICSIRMTVSDLAGHNEELQAKYRQLEEDIAECEQIETKDADVVYVAYGISSRICRTAVKALRKEGVKIGLVRLKTLFPYPRKALKKLAKKVKKMIAVELSNGQMADDLELAVGGATTVLRYNWMGGDVPSTRDLADRTRNDL
jgi:2-oxoisovalerate ferredoxin oxidoreductase alpha subunit